MRVQPQRGRGASELEAGASLSHRDQTHKLGRGLLVVAADWEMGFSLSLLLMYRVNILP